MGLKFFAGTMGLEVNGNIPPNLGTLYTVDQDLTSKKVYSPVSVSNGLIWSLQKDVMYYIDSPTAQVWAFDYNNDDGYIS